MCIAHFAYGYKVLLPIFLSQQEIVTIRLPHLRLQKAKHTSYQHLYCNIYNIRHIRQVPETLWSTKQWELSDLPRITTYVTWYFLALLHSDPGTFRTQSENFTTELCHLPVVYWMNTEEWRFHFRFASIFEVKKRNACAKKPWKMLIVRCMNSFFFVLRSYLSLSVGWNSERSEGLLRMFAWLFAALPNCASRWSR